MFRLLTLCAATASVIGGIDAQGVEYAGLDVALDNTGVPGYAQPLDAVSPPK